MQHKDGLIPEVYELALTARTNHGKSLLDISKANPMLLVFLRYMGCPFCRETLDDLSRHRPTIEATGCQIVLVHMETEAQRTRQFFRKYALNDVPRVGDTRRSIYRAFGLRRGSVWNLIGPATWWRGVSAMVLERHGFGWPSSDPFQLPGLFLVRRGQVVTSFVHKRSSDRPNYLQLAASPTLS